MLTSDDGRVGRAPSSSVRVVCCVHDMKTSLRMPVTLCAKRRRRRRDPRNDEDTGYALGVVLVLHRRRDAVVLHVHEGALDLLVRRGGLELGHEVAVARGAGLVGLGVDRGLRENQSASGLLSSGIIDTAAHLGLGRVVRRRLAAAHRILRRSHETFHG